MFKTSNTKQAFEARSTQSIETLSLPNGFKLLLDFYREVRPADAATVEAGGDMLLYQWGTYNWGNGSKFEINLTRQVIVPEAEGDEDIWQLGLTYRFKPSTEFADLDRGDQWCEEPNRLTAFSETIENSQAFRMASQEKPHSVELTWERV
ncbi:MAG: hypothetical protein AAF626_08995 [Pseudomonadota bacterium]